VPTSVAAPVRMPPKFSTATHPATAIRAPSVRDSRGSQPRNTEKPTTRHAAATVIPATVVAPTVSQPSSAASMDRSGPGASCWLVNSMHTRPPSPGWGSAV
jgi:hypothetical protein